MPNRRALYLSGLCLLAAAIALLPFAAARAQVSGAATRSKYVILVMTDGFRWQELFNGADPELLRQVRGRDSTAIRTAFGRESQIGRREALLPFIWGTIAHRGQILGDSAAGSVSVVTNGRRASYPGYSEVLTGHADPRIGNRHGANVNRSVFGWLNEQESLTGRVVAFGGWTAFPRIFGSPESGVPVYDRAEAVKSPTGAKREGFTWRFLEQLQRYLPSSTSDSAVRKAVNTYRVKVAEPPRVLFIGFNDTDHFAHEGRYDRYLQSAHRVDGFLAELWASAQANPATRDSTTLIVTTDHGRGVGEDWFTHGRTVRGAERIWIAAIGPDVPALGVRRGTPSTQSQVAATVAAALGLDWRAAEPKAARALPVFDMSGGARGSGDSPGADSTRHHSFMPSRPSEVHAKDRQPARARPQ